MLAELLKVLATGGLRSMSDVARELGVSEALVIEMVDGLAGRGYLVPLQSGCSHGSSCSGCTLQSPCGADCRPPNRILALTERGRRAAGAMG